MDIEKYKKDAETFLSKLEKEYYLHFSGRKDILNLSSIYNEYDFLFSFETVKYFNYLKDKAKPGSEYRKKISYLLKFALEGYMQKQVKDLYDRINMDEAKAQIKIDGSEVSFRYSEVLLANEPDKKKRDLIDDRRNEKVALLFNDNLNKYWENLHIQAKNLGFSSYRDLYSYLKDGDFYKLQEDMEKLLTETQSIYEKHFGSLLLRELGIRLEDSRRSDFAFLKRAKKYDRFFKKGYLVELFGETLKEMGIDVLKQSNIHLDVEERENKSPRAFCCTVKVPHEIYLVVMPSGGQDDYDAMFHEGGHAEHFGNTRAGLDFEYKYLGDNAVTEGYAFCFEQLMQNKNWLVDLLRMSPDDAEEFSYFSTLLKLWFCRRYAGKLKYELILHDGLPILGKDMLYKEILTYANSMEYFPENYLKDVDEGFYCTDYIRAWIFEAQIREYVLRKFGSRWYSKRGAGNFLKELWSYGQKYTPSEILSQIDFKELDVSYLIYSLISEIESYRKL